MAIKKKGLKKAQDGYTTNTRTFTGKTGGKKGVTDVTTSSTGTRPGGGSEYKSSTSSYKGKEYLGKNLYQKFENPKAAVNDTLSSQRNRYTSTDYYKKNKGNAVNADRHNYSIRRPGGVEKVESLTRSEGGKPEIKRTFIKSKSGSTMKKKMKNGGSLTGLKASNKRVGPVDPKGSWTKVQEKTLKGAKGKAKLTADKQLGATKMKKK